MASSRRSFLALSAAALAAPAIARAAKDAVTIGWPSDVPSWDPNQRFVPDAQGIFKAVFDQPLDQSPALKLIPNVVKSWSMASDALSLPVELRDDVTFHDGSKLTTEDFRYTFFDRTRPASTLDIKNSWRKVKDIEVLSPTKAVMHFTSPAPTAPEWLAFLGSFIVPKAYIERVGEQGFVEKPIGSGPYRLAEYETNARIVLEGHPQYWGKQPAIPRVTIQIIKDPSARVAAVQSGQVDLTIAVPVREAVRLHGEIDPITRIILLQVRNDRGFADENVRLAAHHAIDKAALSRAFYSGRAVPLSQLATPGTPGYMPDLSFAYDPKLAARLLAKSGHGPKNPVKIGFATTNGQFPNDYDIARAIGQMWAKIGIQADIQVIEYGKYFLLNRGHKLPEATLYTFDNATGDPEIFVGYMLDTRLPFSPWQDITLDKKIVSAFNIPDDAQRIAEWEKLDREAIEIGAKIPLLQSVQTMVRAKDLEVTKYRNGWVLPQTMRWT